jgi:DNA-binding winged helix-turn-helix (wHTH) protein
MLRGPVVVGRDATCDIVIPSRQVSRQHARFTLTSKGVVIEDLGSKNGTHCNGQSIESSTLLKDGDVIQIALAQQFVFLSSDATLPLDTVEHLEAVSSSRNKLCLDKRSRQVWIGDVEVTPPLSVSQFHLLEMLYENEGQVVPRKEIIASIWGAENAIEVSEQALDALVRRLRDRLAALDPENPYIITIRGHGLKLENPPR